jgi:hypothetical protein
VIGIDNVDLDLVSAPHYTYAISVYSTSVA